MFLFALEIFIIPLIFAFGMAMIFTDCLKITLGENTFTVIFLFAFLLNMLVNASVIDEHRERIENFFLYPKEEEE